MTIKIIVGKRITILVGNIWEKSNMLTPKILSPNQTAIVWIIIAPIEAMLNLKSFMKKLLWIFFVSENVQLLLRKKFESIAASAPIPADKASAIPTWTDNSWAIIWIINPVPPTKRNFIKRSNSLSLVRSTNDKTSLIYFSGAIFELPNFLSEK